MIVKLVRHGESEANIESVSPQETGDFCVNLTTRGRSHSVRAGARIGSDFLRGALVYSSPYYRTRQTLDAILEGANVTRSELRRCYEDPRLREVDHGYDDVEAQQPLRERHGWFYYRYAGGESPADCFDRTSTFLESMMREIERRDAERVLIVTHGLTIRCFVMRFLHLTVDQFESIDRPENCDIVTVASPDLIPEPVFANHRWAVNGIRLRPSDGASPNSA